MGPYTLSRVDREMGQAHEELAVPHFRDGHGGKLEIGLIELPGSDGASSAIDGWRQRSWLRASGPVGHVPARSALPPILRPARPCTPQFVVPSALTRPNCSSCEVMICRRPGVLVDGGADALPSGIQVPVRAGLGITSAGDPHPWARPLGDPPRPEFRH
jgi:hypothetical protein